MVHLGSYEKVIEVAGQKRGTHFTAFSGQGYLAGILAEAGGGILIKLAEDRMAKAVTQLVQRQLPASEFQTELKKILSTNYTQVRASPLYLLLMNINGSHSVIGS